MQAPFLEPALLHPPKLEAVLKEYLGPDYVLETVSVVTNSDQDQELHGDVGAMQQHLEVHIALVDIDLAMGPTQFCPATQGFAQDKGKKALTGVEHAIQNWYVIPGRKCLDDPKLTYARAARRGDVALYDANVMHRGRRNAAGKRRPVLMLSYAANADAIESRGYKKGRFKGDAGSAARVDREVEMFMSAFLAAKGRSL